MSITTDRYTKSRELNERAKKSLAGGVSSEFRKFAKPHPLFYARGQGSHVIDVDGNSYLDFTLSQGPLILGHSHPRVLSAVQQASAEGQLYASQHLLELELAEKMQELIPCAELMRFSLSGSEAVHSALRLARAITGRNRVLRFEGHYHGWLDNMASGIAAPAAQAGPREDPVPQPWTEGLPAGWQEQLVVRPWNDLALVEAAFERHDDEIAAVITEPVMCNTGCIPPREGFLAGLREICDRHKALLIFDEVITGFRVGLSGAQGRFGVTPDLAIFGKAMASGYPISALVGKADVFGPIAEGRVIHAGTMNTCVPTVAAALATIEVLEEEKVHERLYRMGTKLMDGLRTAAADAGHDVLVQGLGPMFHLAFTPADAVYELRDTSSFDAEKAGRFVAGMHERGVRLIGRGIWYLSAAHTEAEIDEAAAIATEVMSQL